MHLSRDQSTRFKSIFCSLWELGQFSHRKVMQDAGIGGQRRSAIAGEIETPVARLEISEARRLIKAAILNTTARVSDEEIWDWVINPPIQPSEELRELLVAKYFHPKHLPFQRLLAQLGKADKIPDKLSYSAVPLLSALPEELVRGIYHNVTSRFGDFGIRAKSVLMNYYRIRASSRRELILRGQRTQLFFASNLLHFRDGTGLFAGIKAEYRRDGFKTLVDNTINFRHEKIGIVNDLGGDISPDLLRHFRACEGVFATGTHCLMKVHQNGLHHSWVSTSAAGQAVINFERSKLEELKSYVRHGWKPAEMSRAVFEYMPLAA